MENIKEKNMNAIFNEEDLNTFKASLCTLIRTVRSIYYELLKEVRVELLEERRKKSKLLVALGDANIALNHLCYLDAFKGMDMPSVEHELGYEPELRGKFAYLMLHKYQEGHIGQHVKSFFEVGWPFWEENLKKEPPHSFLRIEWNEFWSNRGQIDENGTIIVNLL